jgi:hypothetical protein
MVGAGKGASAQVTLEWLGAGVLPEMAGQLVRPAHQHTLSVTNGRRVASVSVWGGDGFPLYGRDMLPLYVGNWLSLYGGDVLYLGDGLPYCMWEAGCHSNVCGRRVATVMYGGDGLLL